MALKREISKSIATLQHSVKRLAIAEEEKDTDVIKSSSPRKSVMEDLSETAVLEPVLSTSRHDFESAYEKLDEIGRGGFSVVYRCRNRITKDVYAVKIIDLRPLRLREKFNPTRLRREVDIMRRLRHPNVIQFVEVYETEDQLMVVMEYAPGKELFDVILERKFFSEHDAKPIFRQIASAVNHLHSMDIIHRDIKPENILILNKVDEFTGLPIAKLLDFGLSKHAGLGSAARTFVGTPCYQAPEVEFTAKGLGGTYGPAADCWSLGAVLYVMLVARFPEFDHNVGYMGRKVLRLPDVLWANVSIEAKSLIQSLMCHETDVRITAAEALRHEWLGEYRVKDEEEGYPYSSPLAKAIPTGVPNSGSRGTHGNDVLDMVLSDRYSQDVRRRAQEESSSGSAPSYKVQSGVNLPPRYHHQQQQQQQQSGAFSMMDDMIPQPPTQHSSSSSASSYGQGRDVGLAVSSLTTASSPADHHLPLAPLLHLQRNIAATFEKAHMYYPHNPELASHVRTAAVMCRQQILDSTKLLRKIEQTSIAVLNMFPDLELAVEVGEPDLALSFFEMVKTWVGELIVLVNTTQSGNQASISQLQVILNLSHQDNNQHLNAYALSAHNRTHSSHSSTTVNMSDVRDAVMHLKERAGVKPLSGNDILELFSNLFGQDQWHEKGIIKSPRSAYSSKPNGTSISNSSSDAEDVVIGGSGHPEKRPKSPRKSVPSPIPESPTVDDMDTTVDLTEIPNGAGGTSVTADGGSNGENTMTRYERGGHAGRGDITGNAMISRRNDQMESALDMLRQVDLILEQLGRFWANTEVVLDALTKKGQHTEHFVGFAKNPKLIQRFKERVNEYRHFWEGVTSMCHTYLMGIVEPEDSLSRFSTPPEEILSSTSSTSSTPSFKKHDSGSSACGHSTSRKQQSATASCLYSK